MMERARVGEADLAKVYYIHFTGKRPIYLIIRNLHNGQLACPVYAHSTYTPEMVTFVCTFGNTLDR